MGYISNAMFVKTQSKNLGVANCRLHTIKNFNVESEMGSSVALYVLLFP